MALLSRVSEGWAGFRCTVIVFLSQFSTKTAAAAPPWGGALSGRGGDCYVRDGGVIALVHCSGLPGPAFVIPPPRPYLAGNGGAAGGRYLVDQWDKIIFLWVGPTHNEKIILSRGQPWSMKYLKLLCFIDLFMKFERFTYSNMLT